MSEANSITPSSFERPKEPKAAGTHVSGPPFITSAIRLPRVEFLGADPPVVILNKPGQFKKGRHSIRFEVAASFSYFIDNKEIKDGFF